MRLYANQPIGTVPRARQLRRDAPEPERRLLRALRETWPNLKWRHQAPVGPFYADILCFAVKLVIEVDGDTHADRAARDASRTKIMAAAGFNVLRFANGDVMTNLDGVIDSVSLSLREREGARRVSGGKGEDSQIAKGSAA
jgi:very-short-patch-repair endonuclease